MSQARSVAARVALLALAFGPLTQARVRVLFLGTETDPAFKSLRAAAVESSKNAIHKRALVLSGLPYTFHLNVAGELASVPAELAAKIAQDRWPNDDVYVISPDSARLAGYAGLTVALSTLALADSAEQKTLKRRSHGVLFGGAVQFGVSARDQFALGRAAPGHADAGYLVRSDATPSNQSILFNVVSDGCASFSRNAIIFDKVCGFGPGRGINIVVVNQNTGEVEQIYDFDTWIAAAQAAQYAESFIAQILPERLILIAVADANYLDQVQGGIAAFQQRFGSACVAQITFRDTWAEISQNAKNLAEQCGTYSYSAGWPTSAVQFTLAAAPSTDVTPPIGTFKINGGSALTTSNLITLDFSAISDSQSGLIPGGKVRLSNDGKNWSPMLDFATSQHWVLDRGNGAKSVYAQFRDRAGNWTETQIVTIALQEQNPLRAANGSFARYCNMGSTILALSDEGSATISTDLGSDWFKPQTILPASDSGYWENTFLSCDASGTVLAAGFTIDDKGELAVAVNSSSDGGRSWRPSPSAKTIQFNISQGNDDYPSVAGVCSASRGNLVVFVGAPVGGAEQLLAVASQDGGVTWPNAPVQITKTTGSTYIDTYTLQTACSNSTVMVALSDSNGVSIYRSINGGTAFAAPSGTVGADAYSFNLLADPAGTFVLLTTGTSSGSNYSITARRSLDGGTTWTLPVLVATGLTSYYDTIQAVAPAPGLFYAAWKAQISTDGSEALQLTFSKDGGATWSASSRLPASVYWYSYMLAEKPSIGSFELAANGTGDLEILWEDDRQGLGYGYAVQRFGVSAEARGTHEDARIDGMSEVYAATSTDFGSTWRTLGPLNSVAGSGTFYSSPGNNIVLGADGTAISILGNYNPNFDVRFLNGNSLPLIDPGGPVNAASLKAGSLAPGLMTILSGQNLAVNSAFGQAPALPTSLGDVTLSITDSAGMVRPAALYNVAGNQIRFVVPDNVAMGDAQIKLTTSRGSMSLPVSITKVAPGVFSGGSNGGNTVQGWLTRTLANGSVEVAAISPGVPINFSPDTVALQLTVLATGARNASSIKLMIGGVSADQVAGSINSDWPGLDQVSGFIPKSLDAAGTVSIYVLADGVSSNSLNLIFK